MKPTLRWARDNYWPVRQRDYAITQQRVRAFVTHKMELPQQSSRYWQVNTQQFVCLTIWSRCRNICHECPTLVIKSMPSIYLRNFLHVEGRKKCILISGSRHHPENRQSSSICHLGSSGSLAPTSFVNLKGQCLEVCPIQCK